MISGLTFSFISKILPSLTENSIIILVGSWIASSPKVFSKRFLQRHLAISEKKFSSMPSDLTGGPSRNSEGNKVALSMVLSFVQSADQT